MKEQMTAREGLTEVIDKTAIPMSRQVGYVHEEVWLDNPDEIADAVIAQTWERSDDPEVIPALAGTIGGGGPNSMDQHNPDNVAAAYRVREILLSMLIGPRPNGGSE